MTDVVLNQNDVNALEAYKNAGDREGYYEYLADKGDSYSQLALEIVKDEGPNGTMGNMFAAEAGYDHGVDLEKPGQFIFLDEKPGLKNRDSLYFSNILISCCLAVPPVKTGTVYIF